VKIFRTDTFAIPLPPGHTFPAGKYAQLARRLVAADIVVSGDLLVPREATREELLRVHTTDYLARLEGGRMTPAQMRRIGLPWSADLIRRARRSVGATIECCHAAVAEGCAVSLSGGTHHAFPDQGQGFCIFNDVAVAARAMQAQGKARRILVIDADVHQGNGTAFIFRRDPSVFTFSIHGRNNFPFRKQPGDLDLPLDDGTGDEAYLATLDQGLAAIGRRFEGDLAVYLAGADPHHGDRFGRMGLTKRGLARRDRAVLAFCREYSLPVAVTMAGGYGRNIADTVAIHIETVRLFLAANRQRPDARSSKGGDPQKGSAGD
jgi:acetoin utilization deacetylase AcuC-like enzyme